MTYTERGLLDAVIAEPDDDLPRLVLCDYWDEAGDPRAAAVAAFVRHQLADPDSVVEIRVATEYGTMMRAWVPTAVGGRRRRFTRELRRGAWGQCPSALGRSYSVDRAFVRRGFVEQVEFRVGVDLSWSVPTLLADFPVTGFKFPAGGPPMSRIEISDIVIRNTGRPGLLTRGG